MGDDKQISPTAAFVEERKILQLRHNYLGDQPFGAMVLPGGSLYDLANAMFPGTRVMLQEHFRCVEPIIRFSMRFYTEPLISLRIPKVSERLDPPLIDIYVPEGRKTRKKINEAEAAVIVDEIERLTQDPKFADRSIGVVSLIGPHHAHYIQKLLLARIGEAAFVRHQIACGDSATFQGKERSIMFVSMVASPPRAAAQTGRSAQQRFNVALSRARDRMYLVRSIEASRLNPNDLKAQVIAHFNDPMPGRNPDQEALISNCQSGFERDVFGRLTQLGYCVTPQVSAGPYSIDLVVEGHNDKRLAVELDGDQYHPPEQWHDDLRRQRALERVGWRFWRCWGSSFALDSEGCMEELLKVLGHLAIEPIGSADRRRQYCEHRVVQGGEVQPGNSQIDTPMVEVARGVSSAVIARTLFNLKVWQTPEERAIDPVLLVCEEAHRYVPNRGEAQYEAAQEAIRRIAKEGRKYGVGLLLVSQRPSEVEATVLSQCNSWIVLRVTNDSDREHVRAILPDSMAGLTKMLSGLRRREAIFVGQAAMLPSRILINELLPNQLPKSHDIDFDKGWQSDAMSTATIEIIANRWRYQTK